MFQAPVQGTITSLQTPSNAMRRGRVGQSCCIQGIWLVCPWECFYQPDGATQGHSPDEGGAHVEPYSTVSNWHALEMSPLRAWLRQMRQMRRSRRKDALEAWWGFKQRRAWASQAPALPPACLSVGLSASLPHKGCIIDRHCMVTTLGILALW